MTSIISSLTAQQVALLSTTVMSQLSTTDVAALATTQLSNLLPGSTPTVKLATSMALVVVTFTVLALFLSTRLPEPAPELPED